VQRQGYVFNAGSARPEDIRPVIDLDDVDTEGVVVDAVKQTVGTSASTEQAGELSLEGLTHTVWPTGQVAEGKFDDRSQHPRWNSLH